MSNPMIQTPDGTSKRVLASHFSTQFMMQKKLFTRHHSLLWGAISILVTGAIWWAVTTLGAVPSLYLPAPDIVWKQLLKVATEGYMSASLWQHTFASLGRVLIALFAAILIGVPIGILMGTNRTIKAIFDPLLEFYRPIPPLAYLPLLVIWLGIGEVTKITLIFLAILAPIIISTLQGISTVSKSRQFAALSLGATRSQLLWHVTLPSALPHIY